MSGWLWVVPVMDVARGARFLTRLAVPREDVLVIDNTPDRAFANGYANGCDVIGTGLNHGCARSWNIGAKVALEAFRPGVVLASPSLELGRRGGMDLHQALTDDAAQDEWGLFTQCGGHLICWSAAAFERLGWFDERLWPIYFEDDDWLRRLELAGGGHRSHRNAEPCMHVDAEMGAHAQSVPLLRGSLDLQHLQAYYVAKWGGVPGSEQLTRPFGALGASISWWPGCEFAGTVGSPA